MLTMNATSATGCYAMNITSRSCLEASCYLHWLVERTMTAWIRLVLSPNVYVLGWFSVEESLDTRNAEARGDCGSSHPLLRSAALLVPNLLSTESQVKYWIFTIQLNIFKLYESRTKSAISSQVILGYFSIKGKNQLHNIMKVLFLLVIVKYKTNKLAVLHYTYKFEINYWVFKGNISP